MNFKKMFPVMLLLISAALFSCSNKAADSDDSANKNTEQTNAGNTESKEQSLPGIKSAYEGEITSEQAQDLLDAYLQLKNALVASDLLSASVAARNIEQVLENAPNDETLDGIRADARAIGSNGDLESQRTHFRALSNRIWSVTKAASISANYYLDYCPMAFDHTGGFWISSEEEILNPYFGDAMLNCGSVITGM